MSGREDTVWHRWKKTSTRVFVQRNEKKLEMQMELFFFIQID